MFNKLKILVACLSFACGLGYAVWTSTGDISYALAAGAIIIAIFLPLLSGDL